jgi:hypothetical protein
MQVGRTILKARRAWLPVCALGLLSGTAVADGRAYPLSNAAYKSECGSCHVAYPPQLLSASAWQAIMAQLDRHFGSDASLDAKVAEEIRAYLAASARGKASAAAPGSPPRITQTRWFVDEHDEVPSALWKSEAVKSAANCGACHTRAEQGDYSERTLRLPR